MLQLACSLISSRKSITTRAWTRDLGMDLGVLYPPPAENFLIARVRRILALGTEEFKSFELRTITPSTFLSPLLTMCSLWFPFPAQNNTDGCSMQLPRPCLDSYMSVYRLLPPKKNTAAGEVRSGERVLLAVHAHAVRHLLLPVRGRHWRRRYRRQRRGRQQGTRPSRGPTVQLLRRALDKLRL